MSWNFKVVRAAGSVVMALGLLAGGCAKGLSGAPPDASAKDRRAGWEAALPSDALLDSVPDQPPPSNDSWRIDAPAGVDHGPPDQPQPDKFAAVDKPMPPPDQTVKKDSPPLPSDLPPKVDTKPGPCTNDQQCPAGQYCFVKKNLCYKPGFCNSSSECDWGSTCMNPPNGSCSCIPGGVYCRPMETCFSGYCI